MSLDGIEVQAKREEIPPVRSSSSERAELQLQREAMENEGGGVHPEPGRDRLEGATQSRGRRPGLFARWSSALRRKLTRPSHRGLVLHRIDADIVFGSSPSAKEIERLAKLRMRSILNLNTEGEPGEVLSPNVEASWAETFELQHKRVSIDPALLGSVEVDRFLEALRTIEKPAYVHSLHGRRAAAFMILWLALERRKTGNEALNDARELGIECDSEPLRNFAASEANRRFVSSRARREPSTLG